MIPALPRGVEFEESPATMRLVKSETAIFEFEGVLLALNKLANFAAEMFTTTEPDKSSK